VTILSREPEKLSQALELRARGMAYFDIAIRLGVNESTIARWLGPGDRSKCKPKKHGRHYVSGRRGA
jgi:transposase